MGSNPRLRALRLVATFTLLSVALSATPTVAGIRSFSDGEFAEADWSIVLVHDSTGGGAAVVLSNQETSGGDPGAYRRVVHDWNCCGVFWAAHLRSAAIYDPGVEGSISSVSYTWDLRWDSITAGPDAVAYALLILQGGQFYVAGYQMITRDDSRQTWIQFSFTGVSDDFQRVSPDSGLVAGTPDFSDTGAPIQFGFFSEDGSASATNPYSDTGIDNWQVQVVADGPPCPDRVVNLDARVNGSPSSGHTPITHTLCAGSYEFTLVNPAVDSQALFWAWNRYNDPNLPIWETTYAFRPAIDPVGGGGGCCAGTAQDAFDSTGVLTQTVTLSVDQEVQFYIGDSIIGDNLGGVSLRVTRLATSTPGDFAGGVPLRLLQANTPNPFSHLTSIHVSVTAGGNARLAVYDITGRLVRMLMEGQLPIGEHNYQWDGRNDVGSRMPAGIYFYRLEMNGAGESRKLVLLN